MTERPVIGYYGCSCHNFENVAEWKRAYYQKLSPGDRVRQRHTEQEGIVFRNEPERGWVIVKYGDLPRDLHQEHVENLIKL